MGNETLFRDKPVWKAILSLVVPSVITILIMVIYNMADMFFIGMLGEDTQVAAIAVVGPVFSLANAVATMLGAGGCAVIARFLGAGERENARTVGSLCVWGAILFGILFTASMLIATDSILRYLGATEDMMGFAAAYMRTLSIGSCLMLFSVVMASVVRAEGMVLPGMLCNMAGTVTNIVLDPIFILVLNKGVVGAAVATVLGNAVSSILLAFFHPKEIRYSDIFSHACASQTRIAPSHCCGWFSQRYQQCAQWIRIHIQQPDLECIWVRSDCCHGRSGAGDDGNHDDSNGYLHWRVSAYGL